MWYTQIHLHYCFKSNSWKHQSFSYVILQVGKLQLLKWAEDYDGLVLWSTALSLEENTENFCVVSSSSKSAANQHWSKSFPKSWIVPCLALSPLCDFMFKILRIWMLLFVTPLCLTGYWAIGHVELGANPLWWWCRRQSPPQTQVEQILGVLSLQSTKSLLLTWPRLIRRKELAFSEQ